MQTPKARTNSSGGAQRNSPLSPSLEVSQKISSPKAFFSDPSQKTSPRVVRQLKSTPRYSDHTASSSNLANRTPKERSPKVVDRKSPGSPLSESKRPGKLSELESQISKLEKDLKTVKDQLCSTEALKKQARSDAEESNQRILALSSDLEESQKQLLELSASEDVQNAVLREVLEGNNQALQANLEAIQKRHSQDFSALASALSEIEQLKAKIDDIATESEAKQTKNLESLQTDLCTLKENLEENLLLVEDMKNQLRDTKESEAQAQELVGETLVQLEMAKKMVETLRSDEFKTMEAYNSIASDLDQSRARVKYLDELVRKLEADVSSKDGAQKKESEFEIIEKEKPDERLEAEVTCANVEVEQLKLALEASELRYNEAEVRSKEKIKNTYEMMEKLKSSSSQREAELDMELRKSRYEIEDLKANLMDKETELQGICEENEGLMIKLENTLSGKIEHELEEQLQKSYTNVETLKAHFMNKEIERQNMSQENEKLKMEIRKISNTKVCDEIVSDIDTVGTAEREALTKIGYMTEEVDKSNKKTARVIEQLEAAQTANTEMEKELRKLKVQSDQWRKAAEAAASMLSAGNNGQFMERTGSKDSRYSPQMEMVSSPYSADHDDELLKKNNANMLRKLGVLWKKQQK